MEFVLPLRARRHMNERLLANRLRIAIVDHISHVDLPAFLFEQIDQSLTELNYFKLSNLYNNLETYKTYLEEIQTAYVDFVKTHNPLMRRNKLASPVYTGYMTESLYKENFSMYFNTKELIKLRSLFSVNCVLRMKEFINRRILQKNIQSLPEDLAQESANTKRKKSRKITD